VAGGGIAAGHKLGGGQYLYRGIIDIVQCGYGGLVRVISGLVS